MLQGSKCHCWFFRSEDRCLPDFGDNGGFQDQVLGPEALGQDLCLVEIQGVVGYIREF